MDKKIEIKIFNQRSLGPERGRAVVLGRVQGPCLPDLARVAGRQRSLHDQTDREQSKAEPTAPRRVPEWHMSRLALELTERGPITHPKAAAEADCADCELAVCNAPNMQPRPHPPILASPEEADERSSLARPSTARPSSPGASPRRGAAACPYSAPPRTSGPPASRGCS